MSTFDFNGFAHLLGALRAAHGARADDGPRDHVARVMCVALADGRLDDDRAALLIERVRDVRTRDDAAAVLLDLAEGPDRGLAMLADEALVALAPDRHPAHGDECLSLPRLAHVRAAGADHGTLSDAERRHVDTCARCRVALATDLSVTEEDEVSSARVWITEISALLATLKDAFGGWTPTRLAPALVRGSDGGGGGGGAAGRPSGALLCDALPALGFAATYEYRVEPGSTVRAITVVVDLALQAADVEPCSAVALLRSPTGPITRQPVVGRRRVRRATFRDLPFDEIDWGATSVDVVAVDEAR
jgi:hypothetical protein